MFTTVVGVYKYFEGAAVVLKLIRDIVVLVPVHITTAVLVYHLDTGDTFLLHILGLLNFLSLTLSRVTLTPPSIR